MKNHQWTLLQLVLGLFIFQSGQAAVFSCNDIFELSVPNIREVSSFPIFQYPLLNESQPSNPTTDTIYLIMDFRKIGFWKSYPSIENWDQSLHHFFQKEVGQIPSDQVLFLTQEIVRLLFEEHLHTYRAEPGKKSTADYFGSEKTKILFRNILDFWNSQNSMTDLDRAQGKLRLLRLARKTFQRSFTQDSAFLRFMMSNKVDPFLSDKADTSFTPGVDDIHYTPLTKLDVQLRVTLLDMIAKSDLDKPFLRKNERFALSYIANEIRALSSRMSREEITSIIQAYELGFDLISTNKILPFLGSSNLPRTISEVTSAMKDLVKTLKSVEGNSESKITARLIHTIELIKKTLMEQRNERQALLSNLIQSFEEDPEKLWKERQFIFENYPISTVVGFIEKIPSGKAQEEWAEEFYHLKKDDSDFDRAKHSKNMLIRILEKEGYSPAQNMVSSH